MRHCKILQFAYTKLACRIHYRQVQCVSTIGLKSDLAHVLGGLPGILLCKYIFHPIWLKDSPHWLKLRLEGPLAEFHPNPSSDKRAGVRIYENGKWQSIVVSTPFWWIPAHPLTYRGGPWGHHEGNHMLTSWGLVWGLNSTFSRQDQSYATPKILAFLTIFCMDFDHRASRAWTTSPAPSSFNSFSITSMFSSLRLFYIILTNKKDLPILTFFTMGGQGAICHIDLQECAFLPNS